MSFQDLQNGSRSSPSSSSKSPSQAVAAGIFQINTAVAAFRRLVDAIGTSKDTLDHRQKLSLFLPFISFILKIYICIFFNAILVLTDSQLWGLHGMGRHNTRQRILQLVKDTSAKLKSVSESDRDADVNVMYHLSLSLLPTELLFCWNFFVALICNFWWVL